MSKMSRVILAVLVSAVMSTAGVAAAFPFNDSWHMDAWGVAGTNRAGASGIYGTGGRSDFGVKCSHCHVDPEGRIDMSLSASPMFGSAGGEMTYAPGTTYQITVDLVGEHLGLTKMAQKNGMGLTIEDDSGNVVGRFRSDGGDDSNACNPNSPHLNGKAPAGVTTMLYGDCHGVLSVDTPHLTSWSFRWTAPAAGAGDLTMFVSVVDGDTGGESSLHDDTVERTFRLVEE